MSWLQQAKQWGQVLQVQKQQGRRLEQLVWALLKQHQEEQHQLLHRPAQSTAGQLPCHRQWYPLLLSWYLPLFAEAEQSAAAAVTAAVWDTYSAAAAAASPVRLVA